MATMFCLRTVVLVGLIQLCHLASGQTSTEGLEGFGQVEDCRFLSYEEQQFYNLKLPSFRTDWIRPDFVQAALPHTPAKVQ